MPSDSQDNQTVQKFKSGDSAAFGMLYDLYAEKIYRFVYYKVFNKELAEDIVSDVFMKALERIDSFDAEKGVFSAWLYRIARNTVIDRYRTRKPTIDIDDIFDLGVNERFEEKIDARDTLEKISQYLEVLSPKQREIVTLRIWEELPYSEIAQIVDATEGSVKMTFSRVIRDIREKFGPLSVIFLMLLKP
jgi:RNA polymerase sigma-70 factor, ECF subfamily